MKATAQPPTWDASAKAASLRAYAEWLHVQAVDLFLQDKEHGHFLFLFNDHGLASMNPVPADLDPERLLAGVRQAVQEHDLYGVVTIAAAWTYFPRRPNDHTAIQLLHGEMNVADLVEDDRTEALMLRLESRDNDHLTWLDPIIRTDQGVSLGPCMVLTRAQCLKLDNYFEGPS